MKKYSFRWLRCFLLILILTVTPVMAAESGDPDGNPSPGKTFLISASDFQDNQISPKPSVDILEDILTAIKNDPTTPDPSGMFCVGDFYPTMSVDAATSNNKINGVRSAIAGVFPELTRDRIIVGAGNHEVEAASIDHAPSGANDTDRYGVFVINEDDYPWGRDITSREHYGDVVKQTAVSLADYLNQKISEGYKKPIFIPCHVPLHYSANTEKWGDGLFSSYIFNVLNQGGEAGLNIIFLYGHNHNHGSEDFHGADPSSASPVIPSISLIWKPFRTPEIPALFPLRTVPAIEPAH